MLFCAGKMSRQVVDAGRTGDQRRQIRGPGGWKWESQLARISFCASSSLRSSMACALASYQYNKERVSPYTRGVTAGGALRLPLHGGSGASPGPVGTAWFGAGSWVCCTERGRVAHSNGACLACPTREARALALGWGYAAANWAVASLPCFPNFCAARARPSARVSASFLPRWVTLWKNRVWRRQT